MRKKLPSKNTRIQKRLVFVALGVFLATLTYSQAIIFSDAAGDNVTLGAESHVSIVNNPVLDGINGSSQSLFSDGASWAGYTINCSVPITASNNKLYISFYNPNGFTENQVQLNFENPNQQWLTEAHPAGSADGWYERVIDLSSFEGETLNWLWIAPSGGEAGQIYFDNIYLSDTPSDEVKQPFNLSTSAVIFDDAAGDYVTLGSEGHISVVGNPKLDAVNGSPSSLLSDGAEWTGYTINCAIPLTDSTNKLYISFYNPNGFTENQVQINFKTPNQQWLTEAYPAEATDGWYERVIDLSSFVGDTLTWMWIAPSAGEAGQVYFDNIYLGDAPSDEVKQPFNISTTAVVFADAAGEYVTLGSEEQVSVVGNPVLDTINGSPSSLLSDGAAWEGYTINCAIPVTDTTNKLYISFYNPNGLTENQVQINFQTPNQQWLSEAYPAEATDGWYERVIDLSSFVGDTLTWMWIAPSAGEAGKVYFDNIYLDDTSNEMITMPFVLSTSGIIFMDEAGEGIEIGSESHVSVVDNPMKDGVNDSDKSLKSDAQASWSGYTITCNIPITDTMAYFYISMYNPEDALENQVQVNFTTPNQQWLTEAYPDEATTGWYTRVIDLTAFIDDTLNWIWLAPTAGQTRVSYMDNIYIGGEPSFNTSIQKLNFNTGDVYYTQGVLRFKEITLDNAEVSIFDITGRILQKESGTGSEIPINSSVPDGIYIIRVIEDNQLKLQKKLFIQKQ